MSESEQERFLLTFDTARRELVKVERIGEAGDLTEVDLPDFLRLLPSGPAAGAPQQIVINIYGGGLQGPPVVEQAAAPDKFPWIGPDQPGVYPQKPKKKEPD